MPEAPRIESSKGLQLLDIIVLRVDVMGCQSVSKAPLNSATTSPLWATDMPFREDRFRIRLGEAPGHFYQ